MASSTTTFPHALHLPDLVEMAAERAREVQRRLRRPFTSENLSSYVTFELRDDRVGLLRAGVVRASGCWFMLDINNVITSRAKPRVRPARTSRDRLRSGAPGSSRRAHPAVRGAHRRHARSRYATTCGTSTGSHGPSAVPTLLEWDDRIRPCRRSSRRARKSKSKRGMSGAWLARRLLQAQFGAMLRTPLDRRPATCAWRPGAIRRSLAPVPAVTKGVRRPAPGDLQPSIPGTGSGLLAAAFPLTARLVGHWRFERTCGELPRRTPAPGSYLIVTLAGRASSSRRRCGPAHLAGFV